MLESQVMALPTRPQCWPLSLLLIVAGITALENPAVTLMDISLSNLNKLHSHYLFLLHVIIFYIIPLFLLDFLNQHDGYYLHVSSVLILTCICMNGIFCLLTDYHFYEIHFFQNHIFKLLL